MPRYCRRYIIPSISLCLTLAGVTVFLLYGLNRSHAKSINTLTSRVGEKSKKTQEQASSEYGKLPLSFIENQGQTNERVKFISRGKGYNLFLSPTDILLTLTKSQASQTVTAIKNHKSSHQGMTDQSCALSVRLIGAQPDPHLEGLDELPGKVNYLLGNYPSKWRTNIPTYSKVKYQSIYPGVDLIYYGNQQQLEYDFIVSPGANPSLIKIAFQGMQRLFLGNQGNLLLKMKDGDVSLQKPYVYQELNGIRREITSRFVLKSKNQVGFEVGSYDKNSPLIIDPVLSYSTYLGGSGTEKGLGIAVDRKSTRLNSSH